MARRSPWMLSGLALTKSMVRALMVIGYTLVMSGPQKIVKWQVHVVGGKMLEEGIPPVPFCGFLVNPRIHFL